MTAKHRVLLCGFGNMGQKHFKALGLRPEIEVSAIVDPHLPADHPLHAQKPTFRRWEDVPPSSFDWAVVANPTEAHHATVKGLLEAGKPVLVEKPAATSRAEAEELVGLAARRRLALAVGNIERCNPVTEALRRVMASGVLGRVVHMATVRAGAYPPTVKPGNNVCLDLAVHDLDAVRALAGPLKVVAAVGQASVQPGIHDVMSILLANEDGASLQVHVDWLSPERQRSLRVVGETGTCAVDYLTQTCRVRGEGLAARLPAAWADYPVTRVNDRCDEVAVPVSPADALSVQLGAWLALLAGKDSLLATGAELVDSVALAEAALRAATPA